MHAGISWIEMAESLLFYCLVKAWKPLGEWAQCLEAGCCKAPLCICPQVFMPCKTQTKCHITVVPQQLSVCLLEDLDQRPKSKVSLMLGNKTWSCLDWRPWAVLLFCWVLGGEIGWWHHCEAFHLLISAAQVHLWSQVSSLSFAVTTSLRSALVNLCSAAMPDGSFMSKVMV